MSSPRNQLAARAQIALRIAAQEQQGKNPKLVHQVFHHLESRGMHIRFGQVCEHVRGFHEEVRHLLLLPRIRHGPVERNQKLGTLQIDEVCTSPSSEPTKSSIPWLPVDLRRTWLVPAHATSFSNVQLELLGKSHSAHEQRRRFLRRLVAPESRAAIRIELTVRIRPVRISTLWSLVAGVHNTCCGWWLCVYDSVVSGSSRVLCSAFWVVVVVGVFGASCSIFEEGTSKTVSCVVVRHGVIWAGRRNFEGDTVIRPSRK